MPTDDLLTQHRRAVLTSVEIVSRVRDSHLGLPTPCSEWTMSDLLAHMTAQHHGFAAAAEGNGADLSAWQPRRIADDPVVDYASAAERVLDAFAEDGVLDREFVLPEFKPVSRFPAARAIGFHLIDYVVHGWDVARTLGVPYELDPVLTEPALRIAFEVPNGSNRLEPGAVFQPGLAASADASPLDRILSVLGRSPNWPS
jgi:uncharacterized protein (TIGR03086 family)